METIWKYPLKVAGEQYIDIPKYSSPLCVQVQKGVPCIWMRVDDSREKVMERIVTYGTGQPQTHILPMIYVGTYQLEDGDFVRHVFCDSMSMENKP